MEVLQNIIVYAILGAIQGFSEPIPISSSGHLVIFKNIFEHFGWNFPTTDITFEVLVNTGSLLAIMFYYRKDIARLFMSFFGYMFKAEKRDELLPDFRYCMLLIVATIPAAIGGVLFNDYIETAFSNVKLVGGTLLITAVFLMLIHKYGYKGKRTKKKLNLWGCITYGLFPTDCFTSWYFKEWIYHYWWNAWRLGTKNSKRLFFLYVYACQFRGNYSKDQGFCS